MGGKKGGENTKKISGTARKAEAAAQKQAEQSAQVNKVEDEEWGKGAKSTSKKDAAEAKKADAARKKAEREAMLAEEERATKAAKTGNAKSASKKKNDKGGDGSGGTLDISQLDDDDDDDPSSSSKQAALSATGIDNALDALTLTTTDGTNDKVDRHPERRYKAAYAIYEARRLPEVEQENKGLRRQQRIEIVRREFEKHPDNPFNQASAKFDASKDELQQIKADERRKIEERLAGDR